MEIHNKRKLLRAPPNLTLGVKKDQQFLKNGVSSCNLSRIIDKTQRTSFKEEESILNDFGVLLNTKRQEDSSDDQSDKNYSNEINKHQINLLNPNQHIELQKIYEEYERALEILTNEAQAKVSPVYSFFKAYQILTSLLDVIKSQKIKDFKYELAENIVLNYWKVGNDLFSAPQHIDSNAENANVKSKKQSLAQERERQKVVQNFKEVFPVLEELLSNQNIKINKLTILSLILAKEYFRQKDMGKALQWCEKGFKYCPKFKNTSILLKLHYMKSKIYNEIHANEPQFEQIKKCIFFLKTLSQNATENKEFSHQFMKTLVKRKDQLKNILQGSNSHQGYKFQYNKSTQKTSSNTSGLNKSGSLTKFRKRSISLSKIKVLNQDEQQIKTNQNALKIDLKKSLHKDMVNNSSALNLLNNQAKKDFLKLDINRKTKLKKKGQTLTIWQKNSEKINFENKIAKELEKASTGIKEDQSQNMFRNLMLRRPNQKRTEQQQVSKQEKNNSNKLSVNHIDRIRSDSKEKIYSKNFLSNSSSNIPGLKAQNLKDQSSQGQNEHQVVKQDVNSAHLKNRPVVTSKSDNQLMKFISSIQNQFLGRYFTKSIKTYNNQGAEDPEGQFAQKDLFIQENELLNQLITKDNSGKDEINVSKLKVKNTFEYDDDNPIQEDLNDSVNSYTKNLILPGEENEQKLVFPFLVSSKDKKNSVVTLYGVIEQISLEVKKIRSSSVARKNQQQFLHNSDLGFKFMIFMTINNEKFQVQLQFPVQQSIINRSPENQDENLDELFRLWIYESVYKPTNGESPNLSSVEKGDQIHSMIRRQSVDLNFDTFLIEKIVTNLGFKRNKNTGYTIVKQKEKQFQKQQTEEWERENIFEWRQKNFQYLKQLSSNPNSHKNLLSVNWKSKEKTKSNHNDWKSDEYEFEEGMKSIKTFFIELQKLSSSKKNEEALILCLDDDSDVIFTMNRYNIDDSQSFDKQFVNSYVLYNEKKKIQKLEQIERYRETLQEAEQSFVDINVSDEQSLEALNFSHNFDMKFLNYDERIIHKIQYMRKSSPQISHSFFPKSKYLQLVQRNIMQKSENTQNEELYHFKDRHIEVQDSTNRKINEYIIKIVGMQPSEAHARKKGSVRKSQIIQLQQNLNHNNFIKEVFKTKSSFQTQNYNSETHKKSEFKLKTTVRASNDGKESYGVSAETSKGFQMTKNLVRKSLDGKTAKTQLSKSSMVKILKKALIQPDYKKSTVLMTYFDCLQIKSFFKVMGSHPNYIKLTCFRLKSIYIEEEQNMSYYYLFELQQREARTRMHKFIIGDRQIARLVAGQKLCCSSERSEHEAKIDYKQNPNNIVIQRSMRQAKTLPQKKKVEITALRNNENLSDQNKNIHCLESGTSSRLNTKRSIFQHQYQNFKKKQIAESIAHIVPLQFEPKFSEESLTEVMKMITPHIVIKKDYIYTSVCLKSKDPLFYMMNKFTVQNDEISSFDQIASQKTLASYGQLSYKNIEATEKGSNDHKTTKLKLPKTEGFQKTNLMQKKQKNYFLSQEIKSKKILCQKSIVLEISQNLLKSLKKGQAKPKNSNSFQKENQNSNISRNKSGQPTSKPSNRNNQMVFAILTIIKISKSKYFTIKLYISKFQRSYTLTLDKSLLDYLEMKDFRHIFGQVQEANKILSELQNIQLLKGIQTKNNKKETQREENYQLFQRENFENKRRMLIQKLSQMLFEEDINTQKIYWKNILSLIKIEEKYTDDKVYLIMKISNFHGFIKDCSFLEYFQKNGKIYMIEMTISKKSQSCQYFPKEEFIESLEGNKIRRGLLTGRPNKEKFKQMKRKEDQRQKNGGKNLKKDKLIDAESINCHNQEFTKMSSIYESKAQGYTLYVQIFKIYEEVPNKKQRELTGKISIGHRFCKTTDKDKDEIDSEILGNESVNQIIHDGPNMSERESQSSFSDFKSNNRLIRTNKFRNTLKSSCKSIKVHLASKGKGSQQFLGVNQLRSNYKLMNLHEANNSLQESNEISKINFSFYLCELNGLFKYIDENYSEEFNEEFFILAQMNTAFKMLGTMIIEQFKSVKEGNNGDRINETLIRVAQKKTTILKNKHDEQEESNGLTFKRSFMKKVSNKYSVADSFVQKQVGFEEVLGRKEKQAQKKNNDEEQDPTKLSTKTIRNKHKYSVEELFLHYPSQKYFKKKILQRIDEFKQKLKDVTQAPNEQQNFTNEDKEGYELSFNEVSKEKQDFLLKQSIKERQKFISLHSRFSNNLLVDLHVLSSDKEHKLSSLFYEYDSLLFLISNTKTYEIYTISVKVEEEHPFSFIQILEGKKQLKCIKNRLFKFYRNLLLLIAK